MFIPAFGVPGPMELVLILGIVVLVFGTGKISGLGKSVGTAIREFKESVSPEEKAQEEPAAQADPNQTDHAKEASHT